MAVEMQSVPFIVPDLGPGTLADGGTIKSVSLGFFLPSAVEVQSVLFIAIGYGGAVSSVYSPFGAWGMGRP